VEWRRQRGDSSRESSPELIIDGPAFAYFIYYQCLSSAAHAANALEAVPSYAQLAEAVVAWLIEVEDFGVRVFVA